MSTSSQIMAEDVAFRLNEDVALFLRPPSEWCLTLKPGNMRKSSVEPFQQREPADDIVLIEGDIKISF